MIDKESFEEIKEKYGDWSSWAYWKESTNGRPANNIDNLDIFDDEEIYKKLNTKYVFVGLNASVKPNAKKWSSFHSKHQGSNDYKLRYALSGNCLQGSYITDLIKCDVNSDSREIYNTYRNDEKKLNRQIDELKKEIEKLGIDKPIIILIGNYVKELLEEKLENEFEIIKVKHYSYRGCNKDCYKKHILSKIFK